MENDVTFFKYGTTNFSYSESGDVSYLNGEG